MRHKLFMFQVEGSDLAELLLRNSQESRAASQHRDNERGARDGHRDGDMSSASSVHNDYEMVGSVSSTNDLSSLGHVTSSRTVINTETDQVDKFRWEQGQFPSTICPKLISCE